MKVPRHRDLLVVLVGLVLFALGTLVAPSRPSAAPHDLTALARADLHIRTPADAARVRARVQAAIWGRPGVPQDLRATLGRTTSARYASAAVRRTRTLRVALPYGYSSRGVLIETRRRPASGLFIWQNGHEPVTDDRREVAALAAAGFDVVSLTMPLYGRNRAVPARDLAQMPIRPASHDDLLRLRLPLRLFMDPLAAVVDSLGPRYPRIAIGGLSGGGWTVTVYGAADPRVGAVYPVAGSLPMYLRRSPSEYGDGEQHEPALMAAASYTDMYVLGALDGRELMVWNRFDSCCFAGGREKLFTGEVAATATRLGGVFRAYSDASHRGHLVSDPVLAMIVEDAQTP